MTRKRLNLSLPRDLYDGLCRLADKAGFRGPCEFATTWLRMVVMTALKTEAARDINPYLVDEISEMFEDMETWEPTPSSTPVPRNHR